MVRTDKTALEGYTILSTPQFSLRRTPDSIRSAHQVPGSNWESLNESSPEPIGYLGMGMLSLAWLGIFFGGRLLPHNPSLGLLIVLILAGGAGGTGIVAGWWNDKAWYWLAIAGFATAAMIVAAVAV